MLRVLIFYMNDEDYTEQQISFEKIFSKFPSIYPPNFYQKFTEEKTPTREEPKKYFLLGFEQRPYVSRHRKTFIDALTEFEDFLSNHSSNLIQINSIKPDDA